MPRPKMPSDSSEKYHVPPEQLEAYAMGKLSGIEAERVQGHVVMCDRCCLGLVEVAEFIEALHHLLHDKKGRK